MLKDALLESEQKRDELQFLLITSGSLSLSGNNDNLLTNVTELTCTFLHAVWGISAVQIKSNASFDIYTPICDRNKQWTNNTLFIQQVNAQLAQQPASKEWNIIDLTPTHVDLLNTEVTVPAGAVDLLLPMIGVGIAWAAILAMPYAMLAGALPADKTGVYMGIFNFTIAVPQIVSGLLSGWILSSVFDNNASYIIVVAGISMLCGAIAVLFVNDKNS
jgi:hypothetical protein